MTEVVTRCTPQQAHCSALPLNHGSSQECDDRPLSTARSITWMPTRQGTTPDRSQYCVSAGQTTLFQLGKASPMCPGTVLSHVTSRLSVVVEAADQTEGLFDSTVSRCTHSDHSELPESTSIATRSLQRLIADPCTKTLCAVYMPLPIQL